MKKKFIYENLWVILIKFLIQNCKILIKSNIFLTNNITFSLAVKDCKSTVQNETSDRNDEG